MREKRGGAMQNLDFPFEVKELGDEGTFTGYGSVFNVVDLWDDAVLPGAFEKSIGKRKPAMLWQHNSDSPIGLYDSVEEDARGLRMKGRLLVDSVTQAREAHALLKAGAINGLSIGFNPLVWEYETRKDGRRVRVLKEIDLWEVSLVTFPANPKAVVGGVKGLEAKSVSDVGDYLRDAGLSPAEADAVISSVRDMTIRDAERSGILLAAGALINKIKGAC
jgi:HK97 family phage prohead protease